MKSLNECIQELATFGLPTTKALVKKLSDFISKSFNDENKVCELRRELNTMLKTSSDVKLADAVYNCLVALAELKPNNKIDPTTNRPLCPLSLCMIEQDNLFASVTTGTNFDIEYLAQAIVAKHSFEDPLNRVEFIYRDQIRIQDLCRNRFPLPGMPVPALVSQPALFLAPPVQRLVNPAPAQLLPQPSCREVLNQWVHLVDIEGTRCRFEVYKINHSHCIREITLRMLGENNYHFEIIAGDDSEPLWFSERVERNIMLRDALVQAGFIAITPGVQRFPAGATPYRDEFRISGDAQYVQNALVQLLPMIKTLEGAQVFGQYEQEILNLIPSVNPGMDLRQRTESTPPNQVDGRSCSIM